MTKEQATAVPIGSLAYWDDGIMNSRYEFFQKSDVDQWTVIDRSSGEPGTVYDIANIDWDRLTDVTLDFEPRKVKEEPEVKTCKCPSVELFQMGHRNDC